MGLFFCYIGSIGNPKITTQKGGSAMYDHDHDDLFDEDCEECYEEGYEEGWHRARRTASRRPAGHSSQGCYVATCVYGSYDCPQVWTLRRFRDQVLSRRRLGRAFIRCYYAVSPAVVARFGAQTWFHRFWRGRLDRLVCRLQKQGLENTPYQDPRQ